MGISCEGLAIIGLDTGVEVVVWTKVVSPREGTSAINSFYGSRLEPLLPSLTAPASVVKEWRVIDDHDYSQHSTVNPNTNTIILLLRNPYLQLFSLDLAVWDFIGR